MLCFNKQTGEHKAENNTLKIKKNCFVGVYL